MTGWRTPSPGKVARVANPDHPLARKLCFALWFGERSRGLSSGGAPSRGPHDSGPFRVPQIQGGFDSRDVSHYPSGYFGTRVDQLDSRNGNYFRYVPPEDGPFWPTKSNGGMTFVAWATFTNETFTHIIDAVGNGVGGFNWYRTSGTSVRWQRGPSSSHRTTFSGVWPDQSWQGMLVVTDDGTQAPSGGHIRYWHNHGGPMLLRGSADINGTELVAPAIAPAYLDFGTASGNSQGGAYRFVGVWGRVLTDQEIRDLPFRIYEPWIEDDLVEVMTGAAGPGGEIVSNLVASFELKAIEGTVLDPQTVSDLVAEVELGAIEGTVELGAVVETGLVAAMALQAVEGTVDLGPVLQSDLVAAFTLAAIPGQVITGPDIVSGLVASFPLAAVPGTVELGAVVQSGLVAEFDLSAVDGTVELGAVVETGAVAVIDLQAIPGTVADPQLITDLVAELGLEAVPGKVVDGQGVVVTGLVALLSLSAEPGRTILGYRRIRAHLTQGRIAQRTKGLRGVPTKGRDGS